MTTQPDTPTQLERIGAWSLLILIATGAVAFIIASIIEATQ